MFCYTLLNFKLLYAALWEQWAETKDVSLIHGLLRICTYSAAERMFTSLRFAAFVIKER
jgi:hypothetical protein